MKVRSILKGFDEFVKVLLRLNNLVEHGSDLLDLCSIQVVMKTLVVLDKATYRSVISKLTLHVFIGFEVCTQQSITTIEGVSLTRAMIATECKLPQNGHDDSQCVAIALGLLIRYPHPPSWGSFVCKVQALDDGHLSSIRHEKWNVRL